MNYYFSLLKLVALASALGISVAPSAFAESMNESSNVDATISSQKLAQTSGSIVDVASGNPNFTTLVQAVQAAELVDLLDGPVPYTVFAPTDAAFSELPAGVLDALLLPENKDLLTDVLAYHLVPDEVMSSDLSTGVVDTLNGGLAVNVSPERVVVNDASVVQADVPADNGFIHVINRVLIPDGLAESLQSRGFGTTTTVVEEDDDDSDTDSSAQQSTQEPVRGLW